MEHLPDLDCGKRGRIAQLLAGACLACLPEVGHMQEGAAFETDIHEGRLHPGKYPDNLSKKHMADQSAVCSPLDHQLLQLPLPHDRHTGFVGARVDQDLLAHRGCTVRRSPSTSAVS